MVAALKPDGWLLVEEPDYITNGLPDPRVDAGAAALLAKLKQAAEILTVSRGMDLHYGRRLYGDVLARGLVDVDAEGCVAMIRGGSIAARFVQLTTQQMRDSAPASGPLTAAELDGDIALHDDPAVIYLGQIAMSVWGRKLARD